MGKAGESRMTSHQQKKLEDETLKYMRDRFALPLDRRGRSRTWTFYRPAADSAEMRYLQARREAPRRIASGAAT